MYSRSYAEITMKSTRFGAAPHGYHATYTYTLNFYMRHNTISLNPENFPFQALGYLGRIVDAHSLLSTMPG
jgi:hypothetical protein